MYRIDPKKYAAENKDRLNSIALAVSIFIAALLCVIIYSSLDGSVKLSHGPDLFGRWLVVCRYRKLYA